MGTSTLDTINNFRFFTDKGNEIFTQKIYQLTWLFEPTSSLSKYFHSDLSGYFIGDVEQTDDNIGLKKDTLTAEVTSYGDIYMPKDTDATVAEYLSDKVFDYDNNVIVTININNIDYSNTFNASLVFTDDDIDNYYSPDNEGVTYIKKKVYTGSYEDDEYYYIIRLLSLPLNMLEDEPDTPYIYEVLNENVPNIGLYFPFVIYTGAFMLDKVSADFIAANTMIVLMDKNGDSSSFVTPHLDEHYVLSFKPSEDSELSIITTDGYQVVYKDSASFDLTDDIKSPVGQVTPLTFTIGFLAAEEGCYQNHLGMYLYNKDIEKDFFFGVLTVKTEVEGEDERFRTFMNNFGVPDPVNYSNLFKELEYDEDGKDYRLINKKSKELFLSYDQIFPFAGTYKALINAVNFLGYTDIVFKEWYKIIDSNDQMRDVAVLAVDLSTGTMLKNVLSEYGISMEDYDSYNKLNRLSMIYHLNEIIDNIPETQKKYKKVGVDITDYADDIILTDEQKQFVKENGYLDYAILDESQLEALNEILDERINSEEKLAGSHINETYTEFVWDLPIVDLLDIPFTKPIFTYRNDEIVAKLFGVKRWLEIHIIGVNAYISDISAEGVFINRFKTLGYVTQHLLDDFSSETYFTPNIKSISPFKDSNSNVACTLNEFTALTFDDYKDVTIDRFKKYTVDVSSATPTDVSLLYIGNSVECPVLADEYMFTLTNRPDCGTLYEFTKDENSQILVSDMEIKLMNDSSTTASIQAEDMPLIDLEIANIRKCFGKWTENVEWSVREVIDQSTGNTKYELNNIGTGRWDSHYMTSNQHIMLRPDCDFFNGDGCYKVTNDMTDDKFAFVEGRYYNCMTETLNYDASTGEYYSEPYGDYVKSGDEYVLIPQDDTFIYYAKKVCSFEYTDNTKWHCPMFVISGYKFDGLEIPEKWQHLYDMGEDNKYVIEVIKGRFLFNDDKFNLGAELVFSNDENKMTSREQYIKVKYDYMTDKLPFIELKKDDILGDLYIQSFDTSVARVDYDYLEDLYEKELLNDVSTDTYAYQKYIEYASTDEYKDSVNEFIEKKNSLDIKKTNYMLFTEIYNDNYKFNDHIDVSISRLGDYEVMVSAFDKYNNIFNNKSDDMYSITAKPVGYDIIMNQDYSNNTVDFYRYNKKGDLLDSSVIEYIKLVLDEKPKFPKNYNIYDIESAYDSSCQIEYTNITYALDTPKKNDYFICTNLTEICTGKNDEVFYGITYDSSDYIIKTKLNMLDENPDRVNLYQKDCSIGLCIFDENLQEDVDSLYPIRVLDYYRQETQTDNNYADDSYLLVDDTVHLDNVIDCSVDSSVPYEETRSVSEFLDKYKDGIINDNYKCYAINVSEYELALGDFDNDYDNMTSDVYLVGHSQHFNEGDVVKLRYYIKEDKKILGETAYRIVKVESEEIPSNGTDTLYRYTYRLNGYIDTLRLEGLSNNFSKEIGLKIMYPCKKPVHYTVRVNDDAFEYSRPSGYYLYNVLRTQFHYNNQQMFINDYLDNTYSGFIYDYDMQNLKIMWDNEFFTTENALYDYYEYPVTIPSGRHLIIKPDETDDTLLKDYKVEWRWYCRMFDDIDNWNEHDNTNDVENLFRSVNRYLQIAPKSLGHNSLELTCIDRYGNRLINKGSGRICIK